MSQGLAWLRHDKAFKPSRVSVRAEKMEDLLKATKSHNVRVSAKICMSFQAQRSEVILFHLLWVNLLRFFSSPAARSSKFVRGCAFVLYTEMCVREKGKPNLQKGGFLQHSQSQAHGLSVST